MHDKSQLSLFGTCLWLLLLSPHMASKWNRLASCIISFLSCRFSLACSMTMMNPTRKHVARRATPVSVMLRPGVMKSLASHSDGWLVG